MPLIWPSATFSLQAGFLASGAKANTIGAGLMAEPFLQLQSISKSYPGAQALRDVSFCIDAGEIVGLIGENGAGKSTLMKVLGGIVEPSAGSIRIAGQDYAALSVTQSLAAGVAFVHQELNLFDNLDVAANVFIGREPCGFGPLQLIDRKALRRRVTPLLRRLGCDFAADTPVSDLSIAQCQMLEIVKALSLDAKLIIMDEPTSSLTLTETGRLLDVLADLKAGGVAIIFISHRLNEVGQCADRVVVLRDGVVVGTLDRDEIKHDAMIKLMIGRDLKTLYTPPKTAPPTPLLALDHLAPPAYPGRPVPIGLRGGEILGLGGLVGAALMRALADAGVAILMISSDMEEVIGVSDKVAVMHEGAITGVLGRDRMTEDNIMRLAVGNTLQ